MMGPRRDPNPLEDLLRDAVAMVGLTQRQSRGLLRMFCARHGGRQIYVRCANAVQLGEHVELALSMLDAGMARADARAALMARLGCGRTKAYRLLLLALERRFECRHTKTPPGVRSTLLRGPGVVTGQSVRG